MTPNPTSRAQARENVSYELHTLGWAQFQDLCLAVLRVVLGQEVSTFSRTRDGGRDGTFCGDWRAHPTGIQGSATVQCKFSALRDSRLQLSDLAGEIEKLRVLAQQDLATNYILITNQGVTGATDTKLREVVSKIPGVRSFQLFGREWLTQRIVEEPRLRMQVPRIYGIGDLSQIMDERRYEQTKEILLYLGG